MIVVRKSTPSAGVTIPAAETDLFGGPFRLRGATAWLFTFQCGGGIDVTLRFYKSAGTGAGLMLISTLTELVANGDPYTLEFGPGECGDRMQITAEGAMDAPGCIADFAGRDNATE